MRILVHPADSWGCGFYRLIAPANCLRASGHDVEVDFRGVSCIWDQEWPGAPKVDPPGYVKYMGLAKVPDADVVVIQRPSRKWFEGIVRDLQAAGIRVVVDVDDRYDAILPSNVNAFDPLVEHIGAEWIDRVCKMADLVTATTPALAKRYGYGHGVVLPNFVPAQYLAFPTERHRIEKTIGWPALASHHPGDLRATDGGVAAALQEDPSWVFRVPGDVQMAIDELGLTKPKATEARLVNADGKVQIRGFAPLPDNIHQTGGVPFWDWPKLIGELEIGIVALADNEFNRSKSALKASELASLGIPVVMSPTPDNRRLHALGVGELASGRGQWYRKVRALMRSASYREDLGNRSRDVMRTMTYEAHAEDLWLAAWEGRTKTLAA